MKRMGNVWIVIACLSVSAIHTYAQKIDEEKMQRDIEVAENVLATLIKHELNQQRGFFGIDINGTYLPGYGVTFRLPGDLSAPFMINVQGLDNVAPVIWDSRDNGFSYSFRTEDNIRSEDETDREADREVRLRDKQKQKKKN